MRFPGLYDKNLSWADRELLEVVFETRAEVLETQEKHFKEGRINLWCDQEAKPGDRKKIKVTLPDNNVYEIEGTVERVKKTERPGLVAASFNIRGRVEPLMHGAKSYLDATALEAASAQDEEVEAEPGLRDKTARTLEASQQSSKYNVEEAEFAINVPADDENYAIKKIVVSFVLNFAIGVSRSGYYSDDAHPEAQRAKKGLFRQFKNIVGKRRELILIKQKTMEREDVLVEGPIDEMMVLGDMLTAGMRETYIPKLLEYFDRRALISFAINKTISEDKFNRFIDMMSQFSPELREDSRAEGERFTRKLLEEGILEVSTIFDDDIIAHGRELPWQAELTLARLRKDLKVIPLLKDATTEQIRDMKYRIFEDTIRPLRVAAFLVAVLANCDLIDEEIAGIPELADLRVEEFIVRAAAVELLSSSAEGMLKEWKAAKVMIDDSKEESRKKMAEEMERSRRKVIRHLAEKLIRAEDPVANDALTMFMERGLIPFKSLPMQLRRKITDTKLLAAYQKDPQMVLGTYNSCVNMQELDDFHTRFLRIGPQLAQAGLHADVCRLLEGVITKRDANQPIASGKARRLLEEMAATDMLGSMKDAYQTGDREMRERVTRIMSAFGVRAVPFMVNVLEVSEDRRVRKAMVDSLGAMGPAAVPPIVNALAREDLPWYVVRNLVRALALIGEKKAGNRVGQLLEHTAAQVREEAVEAVYSLKGREAESVLVRALEDQAPKVRIRAVRCLGALRSEHTRFLRFLREVLQGQDQADAPEVRVQAFHTLADLGQPKGGDGTEYEALIIKELESSGGGGLFAKVLSRAKETPLLVRQAMIFCLGRIGTDRSASLLHRLAKSAEREIKDAAERASADIEDRKSGHKRPVRPGPKANG